MRNYSITVNGKTYEVAVEEKGNILASTTTIQSPAAAPAPAAKPVTKSEAATSLSKLAVAPAAGGSGTKILSPMPGKIITVKVNVGDNVKNGQELFVMEAMKMHNPVLASTDGVIKEILVKAGDPVQAGTPLTVIG